jgi:hypothetical protein
MQVVSIDQAEELDLIYLYRFSWTRLSFRYNAECRVTCMNCSTIVVAYYNW